MPSFLAWLDASAEAQRRAYETLELFRQPQTRDELGIGQISDALAEALFPGTSISQTRARFFLIVPWLYRSGETRYEGHALHTWVQDQERALIRRMAAASAQPTAPDQPTRLPSMIYWPGLIRYGILTHATCPDQLYRPPAWLPDGNAAPVDRPVSTWVPTLPAPPDGFPDLAPDPLALRPAEALWLAERVIDATPGTLLAHLLHTGQAPAQTEAAWLDPSCQEATGEARGWLEHARLFSLTMHGAALLLNLLIAERYQQAGYSDVVEPVARYREHLADWSRGIADELPQIEAWDLRDLWTRLHHANPRITRATRTFVISWLDAIQTKTDPQDPILRALVEQRERRIKKARSRLASPRMLRSWSGATGTQPLTYRWPQVRTLIRDITTATSPGEPGHAGT